MKAQDVSFLQAMNEYATAHPVLTGLQVVGLTVSALSVLTIPVLGAVGFTAAGPAAGSVAAAWQASIGAIQSGRARNPHLIGTARFASINGHLGISKCDVLGSCCVKTNA